MHLLVSTDFALRILMRLAAEPNRAITTEELARTLDISRNHLQKVVQRLVDGGFVRTLRGARGGAMLDRPAKDIAIGAVVRWCEQGQVVTDCFRPDGGTCTLIPACRLKGMLANAEEAFFASLDRRSLADCAPA